MFSQAFDWVSASVVRITYEKEDKVLRAGTGFFFRGFLVTNFHVYRAPDGCDVRFKFPYDKSDAVIGDQVFHDSIVHASDKNAFDYAFFDPSFLPKARSSAFNRLSSPHIRPPQVGDEVGLIGFPFGSPRATGHRCNVTAIYHSGLTRVLQLEGSVNAANSGGPLFSTHENAVIGIVTRKESGLSGKFAELQASLTAKLDAYAEKDHFGKYVSKKLRLALRETQESIRMLADELERSSNTGIGYAFSIEHLLEDEAFANAASEDPYGPPLRYWRNTPP